jgi:thiamine-phosphate pyrophosphorylase
MSALPSRLLVVTDRHLVRRPLEDVVRGAIAGGARWFWLRDRDLDSAERKALAFRLTGIVRDAGGCLSIGGDVDLAADVGTGAVHVRDMTDIDRARQLLGPAALVGLSAHSVADAANAKQAGADYVTLSPIHETASKPGYGPALGIPAIRHAAGIGLPVVALGGIGADNAAAVLAAGAAAVAVMGGVMRAQDTQQAVKALLVAAELPQATLRAPV